MVPRAAIEWSAATYDGRPVRGGQTRSAYAGTETSAATPVNVPDLQRIPWGQFGIDAFIR